MSIQKVEGIYSTSIGSHEFLIRKTPAIKISVQTKIDFEIPSFEQDDNNPTQMIIKHPEGSRWEVMHRYLTVAGISNKQVVFIHRAIAYMDYDCEPPYIEKIELITN